MCDSSLAVYLEQEVAVASIISNKPTESFLESWEQTSKHYGPCLADVLIEPLKGYVMLRRI